jgi:lysophospholipase L1-like esterase
MSGPVRWMLVTLAGLALLHGATRRRVSAVTAAQLECRLHAAPGAMENAGALVPFFRKLSSGNAHILHYGDSHTASDDLPDALRTRLQARFGGGGPGFTLAGHPYLGFRRFDSRGSQSGGWRTSGTLMHGSDGMEGLGGVSITAERAGETATFTAQCEHLALFYLQQPGGGDFEFTVDAEPVQRVATSSALGPGYFEYAPAPGPHRFAVRTLTGGVVRLFGWTADDREGVTYETLGINGAQSTVMLSWAEDLLAEHIARRDPALIVVAYGTNEAISPRWDAAAYSVAFRQVLKRLHNAAPEASILVVGPPDCFFVRQTRRMTSGHLSEVIAIQRAVARDSHCAYWNWRKRMGGPGSVTGWVQAGLSQPDYVHMRSAGYRLAGKLLFEELMFHYERFSTAHKAAGAPEENDQ